VKTCSPVPAVSTVARFNGLLTAAVVHLTAYATNCIDFCRPNSRDFRSSSKLAKSCA
jgi:hypothetical protein